jgi:hypothetical protein
LKPLPLIHLSRAQQALLDVLAGRTCSLPGEVLDQPAALDELLLLCRTHRIHPIVAALLRAGSAPSSQLQTLLAQLEADQTDRAVHLLAAGRQLGQVAGGLRQHAIPFLALKGVALLGTVYGRQPLQRPFSDLDLLLPDNQFDEAVAALTALGYQPASHKQDLAALRRYNRKLDFHSGVPRPCSLDVHFCLIGKKLFSQSALFDMDSIWRSARTRTCLEVMCQIPSAVHLLMHLALHLSLQHHLASLRWLYDLKALIRFESELDWDCFVRTVQAARASRAVWLSLETAAILLDAPVPRAVRQALAPGKLHRLDHLWLRSQQDAASILSQRYYYRQSRLLGKVWRMYSEVVLLDGDRLRSRLAAVARWVLPDPWFFRVSYRVKGFPALLLCYLIHPIVVLGIGGCLGILAWQQAWTLRGGNRPLRYRSPGPSSVPDQPAGDSQTGLELLVETPPRSRNP